MPWRWRWESRRPGLSWWVTLLNLLQDSKLSSLNPGEWWVMLNIQTLFKSDRCFLLKLSSMLRQRCWNSILSSKLNHIFTGEPGRAGGVDFGYSRALNKQGGSLFLTFLCYFKCVAVLVSCSIYFQFFDFIQFQDAFCVLGSNNMDLSSKPDYMILPITCDWY